jgi:putative membrane protein
MLAEMSWPIRVLVRLVVLAVIIAITAKIVSGIHVYGGFLWYVWLAAIFSVLNMILGPILRLLSLPVILLTLGLFLIVINAALLALTAWLSSHLSIDSFGAALLGGLLIGVFSWVAELLLPPRLRRRSRR